MRTGCGGFWVARQRAADWTVLTAIELLAHFLAHRRTKVRGGRLGFSGTIFLHRQHVAPPGQVERGLDVAP